MGSPVASEGAGADGDVLPPLAAGSGVEPQPPPQSCACNPAAVNNASVNKMRFIVFSIIELRHPRYPRISGFCLVRLL